MSVRTQLAYRTPKEVGVIEGPPSYEPLQAFERPEGNIRCCVYSPCGGYLAWALPEGVTVIVTATGQVLTQLSCQNVFEIGFSPLGTFIITWQRPSKDENGEAAKNLKVWRVGGAPTDLAGKGQAMVGHFVQKSATNWNLQYTRDERFCARMVSNEVQFFESGNLSKVWNKLRVEGVTDFALSPGRDHAIAIFASERKGFPASVKIFTVPLFDSPVSQKSFFKGDKAQLKWNEDGTSLIVLAQTEVDKSGKSYYGETTLYLMSANGGFDSRIDLDKDGPIHDVTWSPNSKEFGVVYGYMPAKTVLFNVRAKATYNFPLGPRNTVLFSPQGKLVLIAGFGNLAGQVDIYDLEKDHKKICTIEASNASVCEWSPDGIHILTATTSPRLRVDNGVKIWHIQGNLMYNQDMQELYNVKWRPQSHGFPVYGPSGLVPHQSAMAYLGSVKTPQKQIGAYRPPGARGQVTPLAFKREDQGGAAYTDNGSLSHSSNASIYSKPRKRDVPGAEAVTAQAPTLGNGERDDEALSKAAAKNKKKREAKKLKEAAEKSLGAAEKKESNDLVDGSPHRPSLKNDPHRPKGSRNNTQRTSQAMPSLAPAIISHSLQPTRSKGSNSSIAQEQHTTASPSSDGIVSQHDKKIRALLKKLRAIDDLKMRRAGGEQLEGTQIRKMDTEDTVRKELDDLGYLEG